MNSKTWIIVVIVVLAAVGSWFAFPYFTAGIPVEAVPVTTGPIHEFVDEQAVTRLPETYLITMPFAGRIEPIAFTEGTPVSAGQVVAKIVPSDLGLTVDAADAAVARLEKSIEENANTRVEETVLQQAQRFVESMEETVKAAAASVESGRAKYEYAERNLGRIQQLFNSKARSEDDLELAQLQKVTDEVDFRQDQLVYNAMLSMKMATDLLPEMVRRYIGRKQFAEAVLEQQKAEAEIRRREVLQDQQRGTMTSPIDGVVLARQITNERFLAAGTTLLEIGRLEDLEVEADVLSLDVVAAKVGDAVEIYGPAVGKLPARGTVKRIYPAGFTKISSLGVEQQRVKVIVGFEAEDLRRVREGQDLGVGYRVRVKVITDKKAQARVIPRSALFRGFDGDWQVQAVRYGRLRTQDVKIGMMNDQWAEVLGGLEEKELVVLAPESDLADGQRVSVKRRATGQ
jgi:HlyD family secretion protein